MSAVLVRPCLDKLPRSKQFAWRRAVVPLPFALLWLELINQLKAEWSFNPQYGYGWSVPFLVLYLIWKRWPKRPVPAQPETRVLPIMIVSFSAFLFLPLRLVAEANPDWRLISWTMALAAIILSLGCLFLMGGFPWLRHFVFPVVFFLVAVPWPVHFEQVVVQNLMRAVITISVALLNTLGIPALQLGNVIEVRAGLIGIEQACSGVRSLQATLMVSLFLGELYAFTMPLRLVLVAVGTVLAFFCNLTRIVLLVWIGVKNGTKAIEAWHDPAGLTILLVCLIGLWLFCLLLPRNSDSSIEPTLGYVNCAARPLPYALLTGLGLWICLVETGVQAWYRLHQQTFTSTRWAVSWPVFESSYKPVPISSEAERLLQYNEGGGGQWVSADGHPWMMYFFRWFPGRTAALFVKNHRPDVCLPASGLVLHQDKGIRRLEINCLNLPFRFYRFDDNGTPLHVLYCYWDNRSSYQNTAAAEQEDWTARGRLRAAMTGRRETGAQMVELVVWGYQDDGEADNALRGALERIIRRG
jgi:exosortase